MLVSDINMASGSRLDFISVSVYVNPVQAGFSSAPADKLGESEWSKERITADRQAYIARFQAWAKAYHEVVSDAF